MIIKKEEFTTEDLLRILDESKERDRKKEELTVTYGSLSPFIRAKDIKAGLSRIPIYIIYYEYRRYVTRNPLSKKAFFIEFKKHFRQVRTGEVRSYLLDPHSFDLSREGKLLAKKYLEDNKSEKQKRSKEKKRRRKLVLRV